MHWCVSDIATAFDTTFSDEKHNFRSFKLNYLIAVSTMATGILLGFVNYVHQHLLCHADWSGAYQHFLGWFEWICIRCTWMPLNRCISNQNRLFWMSSDRNVWWSIRICHKLRTDLCIRPYDYAYVESNNVRKTTWLLHKMGTRSWDTWCIFWWAARPSRFRWSPFRPCELTISPRTLHFLDGLFYNGWPCVCIGDRTQYTIETLHWPNTARCWYSARWAVGFHHLEFGQWKSKTVDFILEFTGFFDIFIRKIRRKFIERRMILKTIRKKSIFTWRYPYPWADRFRIRLSFCSFWCGFALVQSFASDRVEAFQW